MELKSEIKKPLDDYVTYEVKRSVKNNSQLHDEIIKLDKNKPSLQSKVGDYFRDEWTFCGFITTLFPILSWIRSYNLKEWLPSDLVSGITVGIVHIPQGLGYSLLAGLQPVYGIYSSFFPVIMYTLMATSKHLSIGTFAVTSLLTATAVDKIAPRPLNVQTSHDNVTTLQAVITPENIEATRVAVAATVAFMAGIFQMIFGIFRLGFITSFLSSAVIDALIAASAIFVVTSQIPSCLGVSVDKAEGVGLVVKQLIEIFKVIGNANVADIIITICCITFLMIGRQLNIQFKDRLKIPIPSDVLMVVIGILASYFGNFYENFGVRTVNDVPTGFLPPTLPNMSILGDVIAESFSVAIVAFALNIAVAKMYADRFGYEVDSNQELLAYGAANFVSSFFSCFPSSTSLARSEIQVNSGGKTQVVGMVTTVIILVTILALGPVFEPLPRSVLASIIVVGVVGILVKLAQVPDLFRKSKHDFAVWLVTFAAILVMDISVGLLIGFVFALLMFVARTQRPKCEQLGHLDGSDIYRNASKYSPVNVSEGVVIFKFNSILYYANKDYFASKVQKAAGLANNKNKRPKVTKKDMIEDTLIKNKKPSSNNNAKDDVESQTNIDVTNKVDVCYVIIDCSTFSVLDLPSVDVLKSLKKLLHENEIQMILCNLTDSALRMLEVNEYFANNNKNSIFPSIHDAALYCDQQVIEKKKISTKM